MFNETYHLRYNKSSYYSSCTCEISELIGKLESNSALSPMGYLKTGQLLPA